MNIMQFHNRLEVNRAVTNTALSFIKRSQGKFITHIGRRKWKEKTSGVCK